MNTIIEIKCIPLSLFTSSFLDFCAIEYDRQLPTAFSFSYCSILCNPLSRVRSNNGVSHVKSFQTSRHIDHKSYPCERACSRVVVVTSSLKKCFNSKLSLRFLKTIYRY